MDKPQCSNCRFWRCDQERAKGYDDDREGMCRRYPPVLSDESLRTWVQAQHDCHENDFDVDASCTKSLFSTNAFYFPWTFAEDWCGEHQPLPAQESGK